MKKRLLSIVLSLAILSVSNTAFAMGTNNSTLSENDFLLATGMTQEQIDRIDPDFREYIVESLKENATGEELQYITSQIEPTIQPLSVSNLTASDIAFTVEAWEAGGVVHIYPTYEFKKAMRPRGSDTFSFQLSDAVDVDKFGGKVWYKSPFNSEWDSTSSDTLSPTSVYLNGAEFAGKQLGTPDTAIYIKGCTYAQGIVGTNTTKKICMNYVYNPNKYNYAINFNINIFGFSISAPSGTVYSRGEVLRFEY